MTELLRARLLYPQLVAAGGSLLAQLAAENTDPEELAQQTLLFDRERRTLAALADPAAEEVADAEATEEGSRAQLCREFYRRFYQRIGALIAALR